MYSKNNYKMNEKKQAEKIVRYGIRKLKLGVTLVAVSAGLFFVGNSAQAAETTDNNTVTEEQPQSSGVDKDSEGAAETTATEGETATADNKESVVEGKDISNNMQTTIALTHDNNPVVVDAGHSLSAKVTFAIEKVKAGDYFTVKFSDEVDLAGIARPKEFETNLWIEDSIKLADGKYDPTTNSVKYVVTKEAEVLRNINASKSYYVAINRDKVTETKTITPTISVGNNKETFSVPVKYEAVDRAKTEKAVNGLATSSLITEENEAANKVTSVTYANINREKVSNTTYTERNSNGKNIAQYNSTDTEVKIYKVPKGVALNSSYSYDPTKLEDVTEKYELKYEDNTLNIDFKNIEDAYIIVTTNTTKPEEGQADSEMQVSSSMSGKTENNRYINSTSTTARGITVAGGSDSGSASEDLPYALGNLVWEDKNNNGIQDEDEKGIPNVKVTLVDSKGVERTTTTNEDGQYYFSKVYNGAYTVRFDVPEGYRPTKVNEGTDKEKDSNGTETTVTIQNASDWSIDSGFYKPVGSVDVRYVIKDTDTEIKETQSVVKEELVDSPYSSDTDEYKPKEITKDGKTYRLVGHKGSSDPENGKVTEDKKTVVYEYELVKGNVDVKYITEDGEVLEETASVKKDSPIGEEYQTEQKVFEGYEFVKLEENSAPVSGKVEEQDQHVVYVYKKVEAKKGNVDVKYITEDGKVLEETTSVKKDSPIGEEYQTEQKVFEGYEFVKLEENSAPVSGKVEEQDQHVVYVYKKVEAKKGDVVVKYVIEGTTTELKDPRTDTPESPVGTEYNTDEEGENPKEITKDGKTYVLVGHKKDSSAETGKVVEGTTTVVYEYKEKEEPQPQPEPEVKKGNVVVKYVIEGTTTELKDPRTDTPESPVGTEYNTDEEGENPKEITKDGKTYVLVGHKKDSSAETGKVVEGTTTVVYEYKEKEAPQPQPEPEVKKGDVVVKYVIEGTTTELKDPRTDTPESPVGTEYNTDEEGENPKEITKDGKTYVLVGHKKDSSAETGKVVEGTTIVVYEYKEKEEPQLQPEPEVKKGDVVVKYVIEGTTTELKDPRTDTPESPVGTEYNTDEEGENPKEITKDGKTYVLVGHKKDSSAETGKVIEGTTTVVYEYKEKEEPQPQPQPEPRPQVKEGNVIVEYRDEEGNELKTPRTDTPKSPVGTDYNTDEPGENPRIIEKNGIKYELVRVSGKETGKVVEGTTKVVYIYKKVTTSTPIPPVQTSNNEIKPMQNQKVVTSKGKLPNTGIETSSTLPGLTLIGLIGLAVRRKLKEDK